MGNFIQIRTWTILTAAALMAAPMHAAQAQDCTSVTRLENFAATDTLPDGAVCSTFLSQASKPGTSCHWEFPFRDDEAVLMAKSLWATLKACRPGQAAGPDLQVNHPDSYDLQEWNSSDKSYHVSVKDKGQLQRTLVFFRVEKH